VTHPRLSAARLPGWLAADLPAAPVGIVHIGLGAFHRAHQAVLTQEAMRVEPGPWGICAVAQRNGRLVDALVEQDHLFTVTERSAADDRVRVVGSLREVLLASEQPDRLATVLSEPDTRVVTLTVTEAGYRHDPVTGRTAAHPGRAGGRRPAAPPRPRARRADRRLVRQPARQRSPGRAPGARVLRPPG
jgi:fructuronate reductase